MVGTRILGVERAYAWGSYRLPRKKGITPLLRTYPHTLYCTYTSKTSEEFPNLSEFHVRYKYRLEKPNVAKMSWIRHGNS